jgi:hypothetical protein
MKSNKEVMEYPYPYTIGYYIIGNLPIIIWLEFISNDWSM